jgi:hypothetical protein
VAVDRRNAVTRVPDLPRSVALRAYGAVRFLDCVQGGLEDVEGAIAAGQNGAAAYQARFVALMCLSIRSLARDGELEYDEECLSFDYFAGLTPHEIREGLALAAEALDVRPETATAWLDRFRAYIAETERLIGYDRPLPTLRSPDGAFALVSVIRRWTPMIQAYGWPPLYFTENAGT